MANTSRLAVARRRHGWTLTKLSGLTTDKTHGSSSTYENGHAVPTKETLALLADKLGVTEEFLRGDDLEDIPLPTVSFRALSKMTARARDRGLNSAAMIAFLLDQSGLLKVLYAPRPGCSDPLGRDPEAAAIELRVRWGLGEQPIRNMVHLLEAHGVRVYSLPRQNSDLDAFVCTGTASRSFSLAPTSRANVLGSMRLTS